MIKSIVIHGLRGRDKLSLKFDSKINIFTGDNGIGKTTLLKLIWYVYSGNLGRAISEVQFNDLSLTTENHLIKLYKSEKEREHHSGYDLFIEELSTNKVIIDTQQTEKNIRECEIIVARINNSSLFFPTFRRIEGFSRLDQHEAYSLREDREEEILNTAMRKISNSLSQYDHRFITSVSTKDIIELITNKYAEISNVINEDYKNLSFNIQSTINHNIESEDNSNLKLQLSKIKQFIDSTNQNREQAFSPINRINDLVANIFKRKGIQIGKKLSFGATQETIDSQYLSAGEKQMLSFISYNAFYKDTPLIIDEPETSLHVDWQRRLISILQSQETNNQLLIATHSPFIYSKFSDKEIFLNDEVNV